MSGELIHWLATSPAERQRGRELESIDRTTELALERVAGINRVTRHALVEALQTEMMREQAERVAPGGSAIYSMIAVAGAVESVREIEDLKRRYRR